MSGAVYSKVLGQKVVAGDLRLALFDIYWISDAFTWVDSPQGDLFWRRQRENNHLTPEGRRIIEKALAEIEGGVEPTRELKIGDRVRLIKDGLSTTGAVGATATVSDKDSSASPYSIQIIIDDGFDYFTVAEPGSRQYTWIEPEAIELLDCAPKPSTTWGQRRAIVARMQNGKPAPAHNPHVHATTESATKEAGRLAKLNIGTEFAVLEIVSISKATARVTTEAA